MLTLCRSSRGQGRWAKPPKAGPTSRLLSTTLGAMLLVLSVGCSGQLSAPVPEHPVVQIEAQAASDWGPEDLRVSLTRAGSKYLGVLQANGIKTADRVLVHLRFDDRLELVRSRQLCSQGLVSLTASRPGMIGFGVIMQEGGQIAPGDLLEFELAMRGGGKSTLSLPAGDKSRVTDLTPIMQGSDLRLDWGYVCVGDYDQNSEVNISDLAPLAARLGASTTDGDLDELDGIVDGDGNEEINISDLTPIAASFGASASAYRIYRADGSDPETAASTQLGEVLFSSSVLAPQSRRQFTGLIQASDLLPGAYYFVRLFSAEDSSEGVPSNVVQATGGDTEPPVWTSTVGVTAVTPGPAMVTVEWGEATDAQSPPVQYVVYYQPGSSLDFGSAQTAVFNAPALSGDIGGLGSGQEYCFAVRARDNAVPRNEESNAVTMTVTAGQGLPFAKAPPGANVVDPGFGNTPSLLLLPAIQDVAEEGAPVIAYIQTDSGGSFQKLVLARYTEGAWQLTPIQESRNFSSPAVFWTGIEFSLIAFDVALGSIVDIRLGTDLAISNQFEVLSVPGLSVMQIDAETDAGGNIGVASAWTGASGQAWFSEWDGTQWSSDGPLYDGDPMGGITFAYDPSGGDPWLLCSHGTTTQTETLLLDFDLSGGQRSGGVWTIAGISGNPDLSALSPLALDLRIDAGGQPQLAAVVADDYTFMIPGNPFTATLKYHCYVASYDGASWNFNKLYNSTVIPSIGFPPTSVDITLKLIPAVAWARQDELVMSELQGTVTVDLGTLLPTGGGLASSNLYMSDPGGGFTSMPGYFTGPTGMAFSWREAVSQHACAYVLTPAEMDAGTIMGGGFLGAAAVEYWQAP